VATDIPVVKTQGEFEPMVGWKEVKPSVVTSIFLAPDKYITFLIPMNV
jgi:hypothetical protein